MHGARGCCSLFRSVSEMRACPDYARAAARYSCSRPCFSSGQPLAAAELLFAKHVRLAGQEAPQRRPPAMTAKLLESRAAHADGG
eukprot:4298909-Prymnesium_polylepis.1